MRTLKLHTITLNLSESICHTLHKKTNPKVCGTLKCLSKVFSKRGHQEECVQSAKSTTCVAPCSASQALQVNNKFSSFPSKSEFCQVESNNFRLLSTAKEAKILFFVPDINGEKILPAHATNVVFGRCRNKEPHSSGILPCRVVVVAYEKIDFQTTLSFRSNLESSPGKPFTSSSANQAHRQEVGTTPLQGVGMKGSTHLEAENITFFCRSKVFASVTSIAFLSAACTQKMATLW